MSNHSFLSILFCCVFLCYISKYSVFGFLELPIGQKACANFNYASSVGALVGLENVYSCPKDDIVNKICGETYPVKPMDSIVQSNLGFHEVIFYLSIGPNSKVDAFLWWLPLLNEYKEGSIVVIIADACLNNSDACDDGPSRLLKNLIELKYDYITFKLYRVESAQKGYQLLTCKLRAGGVKIYKEYPTAKYYFKIDTDTIIFPKRFIRMFRTIDAVIADKEPLYVGTVVESGMNLLLCGREWITKGNATKGGLCYGQGGAGYALNNIAFKTMIESPVCDESHPDTSPEDAFIALRMWEVYKRNVIHCGGLSSSEIMTDLKIRSSVSFHYIDAGILRTHGDNLLKHHNNENL